jgi:hypothetical protein
MIKAYKSQKIIFIPIAYTTAVSGTCALTSRRFIVGANAL